MILIRLILILIVFTQINYSSADTLKYTYVKAEIKMQECDGVNSDSYCAKYVVEYPLFYGFIETPLKDSLNKLLTELSTSSIYTGNLTVSVDKAGEEFIKEYVNFMNSEEAYHTVPYDLLKYITVQLNRSGIISLSFVEYSFTGGAHGTYYEGYYNINTNNGVEIKKSELFKEYAYNNLLFYAEKVFRKNKEIAEGISLEEAGYWFENNKFYLPENFLITSEGIKFIYNPYEIASWAEGLIEIFLPYSDIKDFINENSLVYKFIK